MPIYVYACEKCQMQEDVIQKINDPAPESCTNCEAKGTLKKVVTASAFHLKGGGWYKDLYASKKTGDTSSSSTSSTKSEAKAEKKDPAPAKTEKKDG